MATSPRSFSESLAIDDAIHRDLPSFVAMLLSVRETLSGAHPSLVYLTESFGVLSAADVERMLIVCGNIAESARATRILLTREVAS